MKKHSNCPGLRERADSPADWEKQDTDQPGRARTEARPRNPGFPPIRQLPYRLLDLRLGRIISRSPCHASEMCPHILKSCMLQVQSPSPAVFRSKPVGWRQDPEDSDISSR